MVVNISEIGRSFFVQVETKRGLRYHTTYMTRPTNEEVIEDFKENRSSFTITK